MATRKVRIGGVEVEVDESMVALVKALNRIPGLLTNSSCEGHKNPKPWQNPWGRWCVSLQVDETARGWRALERVADAATETQCRLVAWSDGGLRFDLGGATAHCTPDRFAEALKGHRR